MTDIAIVLIGVIVLFAVFIALRSALSLKVCALCAAVSTVWIVLLALLYLDRSVDPVLVGVLMGGSVVGVMYLLEGKLSEKYHLFKLPFFLTLVTAVYFVLQESFSPQAVGILIVLWLLFLAAFVGRGANVKALGRKIIACCKNW